MKPNLFERLTILQLTTTADNLPTIWIVVYFIYYIEVNRIAPSYRGPWCVSTFDDTFWRRSSFIILLGLTTDNYTLFSAGLNNKA
jgi:hypothetical protein